MSVMTRESIPRSSVWQSRAVHAAIRIFLLGVILPATVGRAQYFSGDWEYLPSPGGQFATLTGYNGPGGAVSVPSQIGNLPVRVLGKAVWPNPATIFHHPDWPPMFYRRHDITSVSIPEGVIAIGNGTFAECAGLTNVSLPSTLTTIGTAAFFACGELAGISLPSNVATIGESAFERCTKLGGVAIPASVASIGASAFAGCTSLATAAISEGVQSIGASAFADCSKLASVVVPGSVASIGASAFAGCTSLATATISEGVQSIGASAFAGCTKLGGVAIPASVASIGASAFAGCTSLATAAISEGVQSIGASAFADCSKLGSVVVPGSVKGIGNAAFIRCTSLTHVTLSEGLQSIGGSAFDGCLKLRSVVLPGSLVSIGEKAFRGCVELAGISIPGGVSIINYDTFYGCTSLKTVSIAEGVQTIGDAAFRFCSGLTTVSIPASVRSIGSAAFQDCGGLVAVYFSGDAPTAPLGAFGSSADVSIYRSPGTSGWAKTFAGLLTKDAGSPEANIHALMSFNANLKPGVPQGYVVAPTATDCAYLVKVTPDPGSTGSTGLERVAVQSEWNGSAWYDVLRITAPADRTEDLAVAVRVFKIAHEPIPPGYSRAVARSHSSFAATLEPGVPQSWVLDSTRSDVAYLVKVTPSPAATNQAVIVESAVVRSEYDGAVWKDVLRITAAENQPTLPVDVRVFRIEPSVPGQNASGLASVRQIGSFDTTFQPWASAWAGYNVSASSKDRAYLPKITPLPGYSSAPQSEKLVVQAEWNGSVWNDVLRVKFPGSSLWEGTVDVFRVEANSAAWGEGINGALSTDFAAPTEISLVPGTNSIIGRIGGDNRDIFRFVVPSDRLIDSIRLRSYSSTDPVSWIGLQSGSSWTAADNPSSMLAQQHFGTANIDSDLLGVSVSKPLRAGSYTVRAQQLRNADTHYRLDIHVAAAPSPTPSVDRKPPTVRVTVPEQAAVSTRAAQFTLKGRVTDNVSPTRVQVRTKAPNRNYGDWVSANLATGSAKTKSWSCEVTLNSKGAWLVQVRASDARNNRSESSTVTINRQ